MATGTPTVSIMDLVFGVLDRLFKDNVSGKVLISRILAVVVLFVLIFVWYKGDLLMQTYKDSRYENYIVLAQAEKDAKFEATAVEQLQIVQASSGADFSAIYSFRPKNMNYFVDMVAYEGKLPSTINAKNLGGFPIDKTSTEYSTHLLGEKFVSNDEWVFLPTKQVPLEISYTFSCPYFNLDNVYSGAVAMYWFEGSPIIPEKRLSVICGQASRTLGRIR